MEISITRGLSELKLLSSRINGKIGSTQFIAEKKKSAKKINNTLTVEEFGIEAQSGYDSIIDLIERRKLIKSLIVKSNAETIVKIGEKEMTVADAIERKASISLDKALLNNMLQQYNSYIADVNRKNEAMEMNLDKQVQAMMGGDNKKTDGVEAFSTQYRETNGWDVIDPLKLKDKIEVLKTDIEDFETNVDFVLSESNASTKIVIPD
jgi:hypothetical protein